MIDYLTIEEVCHLLCINRRTLYLWIKEGVIKAVRNEKGIFIPLEEIQVLLNKDNKEDVLKGIYYTTRNICDFLGYKSIGDFTRNYINTGKLKSKKIRGKYLIEGKDLEKFFNNVYRGYKQGEV